VESYASAAQVWAAGLVFTRVGAMVMMMPGVGDPAIPARVRLSFAFLLALVLAPVVSGNLGPMPSTVAGLAGGVIHEALIGLMIGAILKIFLGALTTAGEVISLQTTLGFAQTANPSQAQSTTAISAFLSMLGLLLIMTTDLHHLFIGAIANSFQLFPFNKALPVQDATTLALQTVSGAFALGIQLAAPVIVFSLVFNLATGLVGRVMPAFQIFFVASPLSVLLGLSIFALSLGGIGVVWADHYRDLLDNFGG
jgi:flagellar biosynthetic protein FliR